MEITRSKIIEIISLASGNSCSRGLDYYKSKKVTELDKINETEYLSVVKGTKNQKLKEVKNE